MATVGRYELAEAGLPMEPDREACWRDWSGWRVDDDDVLLGLAGLTMAPDAPWSSDRSLRPRNPAITRVTRNRRANGRHQEDD